MSAITAPSVTNIDGRTSTWVLARIEAKRYARHPLFLIGVALCTLASAGKHGPEELDYHVIPSFFIGVLGIIVAARLTASTDRSAPVVDAAPVSDTARTAAMCLACAVPTAAGLLIVLMHRLFVLADPVPDWLYGTYGPADRLFITVIVPVIACAGGPLLGVAVARWLRFPGAALLAVIAVLFWSNITAYAPAQMSLLVRSGSMDSSALFARVLHMFTPYTAFASGNGDGEHASTVMTSFTGSPGWFALWTLALCGLAAVAALWRTAEGEARRSVGRAFVVLAAIAVVALVLSVVTGNQTEFKTTRDGTVAVALGSPGR
jgi:hypothetical protein